MTKVFAAKAWLGGTAMVAGLVGMAFEWRWLVFVAVAMLGVAFLLRFAERKPHREP